MAKYLQGDFKPQNPAKYKGDVSKIRYMSSWELTVFKFFDTNPDVLEWSSEEVIIRYFSKADNKIRRYMVDCYVKYVDKDGNVIQEIVEIKPHAQTLPPKAPKKSLTKKQQTSFAQKVYTYNVNQDKWAAAEKWAKGRGMKFRVLTEKQIFR